MQRGVTVPLSATEFQDGLAQRFPERDGMFFLPEQVAEYDTKRLRARELVQLELFVKDEESAIRWLRQQLTKKPQTFQEIHPHFIRELGGWQKHEKMIELSEFLKQNFLCYDGKGEVPSQSPRLPVRQLQGVAQPAEGRFCAPRPRPGTGGTSRIRARPVTWTSCERGACSGSSTSTGIPPSDA